MTNPVILVIAPMPVFPCSAGNRRRLLATCEFLKQAGFDIDFVYLAHEDQIYRRFGQNPPTDMAQMVNYFRRVWLIELAEPIKLKTGASSFELDDWCPRELEEFVEWYFGQFPSTSAILVNYVFLSAALLKAPDGILRIIDTHDRFSGRRDQYLPFRLEPNFYYTDAKSEAEGLLRADIIIAIQPAEQAYFSNLVGHLVDLLMPDMGSAKPFLAPTKLAGIGFMGHGNDANLVSISRFSTAWQQAWRPGWPILMIAGEICKSLPKDMGPSVRMLGYVEQLSDFFDVADLVIAPMLMGTGLKVKVIEALAYGKPVIGTPTAFEGLDVQSKDHQIQSISEMIERIREMTTDNAALVQLTADSEMVFNSYRETMQASSQSLLAKLAHIRRTAPEIAEPAERVSQAADEIFRFGPITFTALTTTDTLAPISNELGILVATEFLSPTAGGAGWETTARPERRSWWIRREDNVRSAPEGAKQPLTGRRVNLAPLVVRQTATNAEEMLCLYAARILAESIPDWIAESDNAVLEGGILNVAFKGPSFLLRENAFKHAFLIVPRLNAATRIQRVAFEPLSFSNLPSPRLTLRCGDSIALPMVLQGHVDQELEPEDMRSTKILLASDGLCGHISMQSYQAVA